MYRLYCNKLKKAIFLSFFCWLFLSSQVVYALAPTDPRWADQLLFWQQVNAPAAWDIHQGSRRVIVAIIDTGADTWHDDLRDNIWTNLGEFPDNGIDDDHNGYIDDTQGWNFVENNNDVRTSVFESEDDPEAVRHGTLVAGLIGARANNNHDGVGLNWLVSLMPLRAIANSGAGSYRTVAQAVNYAVNNGAQVISMSFVGDRTDEELISSLHHAYEKNVVVVAAAGNHSFSDDGDLDKKPVYPACLDQDGSVNWLLAVGSVSSADHISRFSNFGRCLDIMAPGENIFSTERYSPQYGYKDSFSGPWRGTSFATPFVAGAAALLKAVRPDWGADAIIAALVKTADNIDSLNPDFIGKTGYGRLNVGKAIALASENQLASSPTDIYTVSGGDMLWRFNFTSGHQDMLGRVQEGSVLSTTMVDSVTLSEPVIITLIKRSPYIYLRKLRLNGDFIGESPLINELGEPVTSIPNKIRPILGPDSKPRLLVETYRSPTNTTSFTTYTLNGRQEDSKIMLGRLVAWDSSAATTTVTVAQLSKKKLTVRFINWSTDREIPWQLSGIDRVDDLKVGPLWDVTGQQAALVVKSGKLLKQIVIDSDSGSSLTDIIGRDSNKNNLLWHLALGNDTGHSTVGIFRYQLAGGAFNFRDGHGQPRSVISLPVINGILQ